MSRWLVAIMFAILLVHTGCKKSAVKLQEEKAQNLLLSEKWEKRDQGLFILRKLQENGNSLSKKTVSMSVDALKEAVQTKEAFMEKGKAQDKILNQIEEEFDRVYPYQAYNGYLESLVYFIVDLKAKEGIPVIFRFILDGGYVSSGAILTDFGDSSFNFLIDKLSHGSNEEQELAMTMLSIWANPPQESDHIDPASIPPLTIEQKQKLKNELKRLMNFGNTDEIRSQTKEILKEKNL